MITSFTDLSGINANLVWGGNQIWGGNQSWSGGRSSYIPDLSVADATGYLVTQSGDHIITEDNSTLVIQAFNNPTNIVDLGTTSLTSFFDLNDLGGISVTTGNPIGLLLTLTYA